MVIEKKIYKEYFEAILNGSKTYDLRLADFEINVGDTLVLKEWNPDKKDYTGRVLEKEVTYVGKFKPDDLPWTEEEIEDSGLQMISFKN